MNTPQDYLNTLEGFPENQSILDRDNLCSLLEGYWEWRESKEWIIVEDGLPHFHDMFTDRVLAFDGQIAKVVSLFKNHDGRISGYNTQQECYMHRVLAWRKLPKLPK